MLLASSVSLALHVSVPSLSSCAQPRTADETPSSVLGASAVRPSETSPRQHMTALDQSRAVAEQLSEQKKPDRNIEAVLQAYSRKLTRKYAARTRRAGTIVC